jgi:hypothetical protein
MRPVLANASRALPPVISTFAALALIVLTAALVWWWWTFDYVVANGYMPWTQASVCLLRDNDICALAKALCLGSHPRAYATYQATAFWIGAATLSLSLWAHAVRGAPVASE